MKPVNDSLISKPEWKKYCNELRLINLDLINAAAKQHTLISRIHELALHHDSMFSAELIEQLLSITTPYISTGDRNDKSEEPKDDDSAKTN